VSLGPAALPGRPSPGVAGAYLGTLYAEHARMVFGISRLMLRDLGEAEDATQQTFLLAYRGLLAGTHVEKPGAWLGAIARNECRARIQTRMREPLAAAETDTLVSPGAEEQAADRAQAAELYAELAVLPAKQREAVVLRDIYGLRYDEVATALGTSRPAVEALLFRGRRRLQMRLRPGVAAGVLAVPLAIQESLAYAVPGFASTAVPAAAVGSLVAAPLLAKLAAAGAAVGIAGSAGVAVERLHDSPVPRPAVSSQTAALDADRAPKAAELGRVVAPRAPEANGARRSGNDGGTAEKELAAAAAAPARAREDDDDERSGATRPKPVATTGDDGPEGQDELSDDPAAGDDPEPAVPDADEVDEADHEPEERQPAEVERTDLEEDRGDSESSHEAPELDSADDEQGEQGYGED